MKPSKSAPKAGRKPARTAPPLPGAESIRRAVVANTERNRAMGRKLAKLKPVRT